LPLLESGLRLNDDGLIDPEISPAVIGQSIDLLDYVPYEDQNERKTAPEVLTSGQIIVGSTIDFESMTSKDGRITVFNISARGYVFREEVPFSIRGIKVSNDTIMGYSSGKSRNHFLDGGGTGLGVAATGFYGQSPEVSHVFQDKVDVNGLGIQIDTEDYDSEYQTGAFGTSLYSSEFGTDSIAYAGLKK